MTADEAIKNKDWKALSIIQTEDKKIRKREELKKSDDEFFSYAVAKAKKQKKIRMGG